jgi:hypothetical protein
MAWHGMAWHNMTWHNMTWHGVDGCVDGYGWEVYLKLYFALFLFQQCKKHTIDDHFLIANQTAEALTFMRNSKPRIIHRDVKPANILIGEDMHV